MQFRREGSQDRKVFMGHGKSDPVVQSVSSMLSGLARDGQLIVTIRRFPWGEMSYNFLKDKLEMPNVEFHAYKGRGAPR